MESFVEAVASMSWLTTLLGLVVLIIGGFAGAVQIRMGLELRHSRQIQNPRTGAVVEAGGEYGRTIGNVRIRLGVLLMLAAFIVSVSFFYLPYLAQSLL